MVLTIPISYSVIMLGYTYAQVFDSKLEGFLFSVPIVYSGCLTGAFLAFVISRYLFKDFIKDQIKSNQWLSSNFKMIDDIVSTEGFKVIALLRLTYAPFGITSYLMGVSSISLNDYMFGNITYIFNCCTHCFIGVSLYTTKLMGKDSEHEKNVTRITLIVEICLTIIVTVAIGIISKQILEKKLKEREESFEKAESER